MELFKTKPRRSNGQFATREMAYADKQAEENRRLRYEVEKYRRMYLSVAKDNIEKEKELQKIKSTLKEISQ